MERKPKILFVALTLPDIAPANLLKYRPRRSFVLTLHKHSVIALVAWLRENGCDGRYFWCQINDQNARERIEEVIRDYKPDALGFSLVTEELLLHYRLIEQLKESFPDIPVIIGGPHAIGAYEHTVKTFPLIDFVCTGEGEITLTEWLKMLVEGKSRTEMREIKGLAFRDESGNIVITPHRPTMPDMNLLPDPAFDIIVDPNAEMRPNTAFPIMGSYGCRHFCTFCAADHGNYRFMKPERIVNQIENAVKNYGVKYFAIRDNFWPPTPEWCDEFCSLIEKRNLKITFHFETRAGTLNEAQYKRLKSVGGEAAAIGVESGDPGILKRVKKGITPDMVRKTFDHMHKAGIFSVGFYMFGLPGETRETIRTTEKYMRELNSVLISLAVFRPLPGTEAFQLVKEEDRDWWMKGPYPSICEIPTEELHKLREDVDIRYPVRWAYLWQHVFAGKLTPEFRLIAWKAFRVHLLKVMLGISERYGITRSFISNMKKIIKTDR
ncbi:MAG: radical SAM protein [bacterium]